MPSQWTQVPFCREAPVDQGLMSKVTRIGPLSCSMNIIMMKRLALWFLLLIQTPTVVMSDTPLSEEIFGNLVKRTRDDESSDSPDPKRVAGSLYEQPEKDVQTQQIWVPLTTPAEQKMELLCETLRRMAVKWRLLLPTKQELEPRKPYCGLPLDPRKIVDADIDKLFKDGFRGSIIGSDWIRKSETGNIVILPCKDNGEIRTIVRTMERRYVLSGGVAAIIDRHRDFLAWIHFTANANGISADGFKDAPFETKQMGDLVYEGLGKNRILPNHITSPNDDDFGFNPRYLVYEDVGPFEAPYPMPHVLLREEVFYGMRARQAPEPAMDHSRVFEDVVGLIRVFQLWRELHPEYKGQYPECTFEHSGLKELNEKLDVLKGNVTMDDEISLLLTAYKIIRESNAKGNNAGDIDDEEDVHDQCRFLRVLMEKERKVGESFAIELDDHLVPKETVGEDICNKLFGKLAFYRDENLQIKKVPYEIEITYQGESFPFRLIARLTKYNTLYTYRTDDDCNQGGKILKVAYYSSWERVIPAYLLIEDTKKVSLRMQGQLLIYQYVSDEIRWKRTKVAPPTDLSGGD